MINWEQARRLLEQDRVWGAYALADLDPAYRSHTEVWVTDDGLLLRYAGLLPHVLFALGNPGAVDHLFGSLVGGRYQYTLLDEHRSRLGERLKVEHEVEMARMVLANPPSRQTQPHHVRRLNDTDAPAVERLISGQRDAPDAFHPGQLENGAFFGVWVAGELVSIAGTHVVSDLYSVAAVGNVFTKPERRGSGYGRVVSAAVVHELGVRGLTTIVLNVNPGNKTALRLYRELGFVEHCRYWEGVGHWTPRAGDEIGTPATDS
jgi:GNAT superfamily N-acetyltransferase